MENTSFKEQRSSTQTCQIIESEFCKLLQINLCRMLTRKAVNLSTERGNRKHLIAYVRCRDDKNKTKMFSNTKTLNGRVNNLRCSNQRWRNLDGNKHVAVCTATAMTEYNLCRGIIKAQRKFSV